MGIVRQESAVSDARGPKPFLPAEELPLCGSRVKRRWHRNEACCATLVHLKDTTVMELVGSLGFDCIMVDLEHHPTSLETFSHMAQASRVSGVDIMARAGKGEFMRMGRLLECGARGILYPRCDDAAEARQAVRWSKFAPLGERGYDGTGADGGFAKYSPAEYVKRANATTWLAAQVESPAAVPHARAIAEVEGVDMVFFGPGDYATLIGVPGQAMHPDVLRGAEQTARDTIAAGKVFGAFVTDDQHARRMLDIGARFLARGSDVRMLRESFTQLIAAWKRLEPSLFSTGDGQTQNH